MGRDPGRTWGSDETNTVAGGGGSLVSMAVDGGRSQQVKVEGEDLEGNRRVYELEGLKARILQHEIDHLEGTMVINRTSKEQRKEFMSHLRNMKLPGE